MEHSAGGLARAVVVGVVLAVVAGATAAAGLLTGSFAWALAVLVGGTLGALTTLVAVGASSAARGDMLPALRAQIDPVTGLPREEKLDGAIAGDHAMPRTLYRFGIEGFRSYNDAFGEACGDALLAWLARKLRDAVGDTADAYRIRGAGFAVVAPGAPQASDGLRERCVAALQEAGEGFRIGCVAGAVEIPSEATDARAALELAERRARVQRRPGRKRLGVLPVAEAADLVELGHSDPPADELAVSLGCALGLPSEQLDDVAAAVRLRDIGNLAVPESVFERSGRLPGHEWEFIQLHTVVGERLLGATSEMTSVARLIRSSHERFDGSGYPDGLSGEEIPLGSRIVFVCSAFQDMTTARAHRPALSVQEALDELTEGAGTQFDPVVVQAFRNAVTSRVDAAA